MSQRAQPVKIEAKSILELCRPPDGYTFVRGAWATHDLDLLTVAEYIAPALVGSVATERRQRRLEGRTFPEGKGRSLLLFPSIEQQNLRGIVPWCHVFPIGGRRQHAKFALLQFESEQGGKTRTRVLVMSANLTNGGIKRNREIIAWEEIGSLQSKASIAPAVLREFRSLGRDSGRLRDCKPIFDEMARAMRCAELSSLQSSIGEQRFLLRDLPIHKPVKRVVVVSPPFASNADNGPASLLAKYIGSKTTVEIYTGAHVLQGESPKLGNRPAFSRATLTALQQKAAKVQLYAVPELIPDEDAPASAAPMRRMLHAKLLAFVTDEVEVHLLVGSANFTRSALEGKNRELMLSLVRTEEELNTMLEELQAEPCPLSSVRPAQTVEEHSHTVEPLALRAEFTVDSTASPHHGSLRGHLKLIGDELPVQIIYRGAALKLQWEQPLRLHESDTSLDVTMASSRSERIHIHVKCDEDQFWSRIPHEDADVRPDTGWQHLLLDLRKDHRNSPNKKTPPTPTTTGVQADGFYITLEQRLVTLARYRHRLRQFSEPNELENQLRSYFEKEEEARQVACALLAASSDVTMDNRDTLLLALREAVPLFPANEELSHA